MAEEAAPAQDASAADEPAPAADAETTSTSPRGSKSKPAVTLADMFKQHASKASGAEATSADISKWCKDAGIIGKTCDAGHVDISFTKVKQKTSKLVKLRPVPLLPPQLMNIINNSNNINSVVFDCSLYTALCENVTSFTKPEVHNLLHCRQKITKSLSQDLVSSTECLVKFWHMVFDICKWSKKQTNKQTDTLITTLRTRTGGIIIMMSVIA